MSETETIQRSKIVLVDDHVLVRKALAAMLNNYPDCQVVHEAASGRELLDFLSNGSRPDVIVLDINMPEMDGFETAGRLYRKLPDVPVLVLTMFDSELSLIRLLQNGVRGFLKKDVQPDELRTAIHTVQKQGYYYSHHVSGKLANMFRPGDNKQYTLDNTMFSQQELDFLELACTDLTYKEIALQMGMNPRTIDNMRDQLFTKLDVRSRVGLAILTMRNGLVRL